MLVKQTDDRESDKENTGANGNGSGDGNDSDVEPTKEGNKNGEEFYMCAVASKDKQVTLWFNYKKEPVLVLRRFLFESCWDLAWFPDSTGFIGCSQDGAYARVCIHNDGRQLMWMRDCGHLLMHTILHLPSLYCTVLLFVCICCAREHSLYYSHSCIFFYRNYCLLQVQYGCAGS